MLLTSASAPAYMATKKAKARNTFAFAEYCFLYLLALFYIFIGNMEPIGDKSVKNDWRRNCPNGRKGPYLQGPSQFETFWENKIKYDFL